jgi:DNA-binding phage protein
MRSQVNSVNSPSQPAETLTKSDRAAVVALVREAMARVGLSQKAMAANAEIAESVLSDALAPHGTRHLAMAWLLDQDDEFLVVLLDRITVARGLTDQSRRDAKAARVSELVRLILEVA